MLKYSTSHRVFWPWLLVIFALASIGAARGDFENHAVATAEDPYLLGIHLGPEYIVASSYWSPEHRPRVVAWIRGDADYQNYLADCRRYDGETFWQAGRWYTRDENGRIISAPPEQHNWPQAEAIFDKALRDIKKAASLAQHNPGAPVEIRSIARPLYMNESSVEALARAAKSHNSTFDPSSQIIRNIDTPWLAYQLDTCPGLEVYVHCTVYGSLAYFEFNKAYLELTMTTFSHNTNTIVYSKRYDELGSGMFDNSTSMIHDSRFHPIISLFAVHRHFGWDRRRLRLVVAGDASPAHLSTMQHLLKFSISESFEEEHSPFELGALGAGYHGKRQDSILQYLGWRANG